MLRTFDCPVFTPYRDELGSGYVAYKGPKEDLPITGKYEFYHKLSDVKPFHGGNMGFEKEGDVRRTGGGGGVAGAKKFTNQPPFEEIRKKYVKITWTTKDGKTYEEEFNIQASDL